jgi:hypothetical protein
MTECHLLNPDHIDYIWDAALPMIEAASLASRRQWTADDVYELVKSRKAQMWLVWDSWGVLVALTITEIVDSNHIKVGRLVACAGQNIRRWSHHIATLEAWAKKEGCTAMHFGAHPSIAKLLARRNGYEITHLVLEKEL